MGIRIGKKLYQMKPGAFLFECPGCGTIHPFYTDQSNVVNGTPQAWLFNGDGDKPTIQPSLDVFRDDPKLRCHSWIFDGKITFLMDSHHALKGQTVDIPDWD